VLKSVQHLAPGHHGLSSKSKQNNIQLTRDLGHFVSRQTRSVEFGAEPRTSQLGLVAVRGESHGAGGTSRSGSWLSEGRAMGQEGHPAPIQNRAGLVKGRGLAHETLP